MYIYIYISSNYYICFLILMCPHTCAHTTVYVPSLKLTVTLNPEH